MSNSVYHSLDNQIVYSSEHGYQVNPGYRLEGSETKASVGVVRLSANQSDGEVRKECRI